MFVFRWLHSILLGNRSEITQAAGREIARKIEKEKKTKPVDLINAALVQDAEDLDDLLSMGTLSLRRKRIKQRVRRKVASVIADKYDDPDLIEEVTERITDAAEIDPYYRNLFCKDD